jgi:WD40 repeat protein
MSPFASGTLKTGKTVCGPIGRPDPLYSGQLHSRLTVKFVVSGSDDKTICIWDATTGQKVSGPFLGHTGYVRSVHSRPDGKRVVSGSEDETIRIWDVDTCLTVLGPSQWPHNYVRSVAFSP